MRTTTLALMACLLGAAPVSAQDSLWVRRLDLGSDEAGLGIASGGNAIAVAGYALPNSTLDWLVVRLNQSGNIIWTRTYDSGADEYAYDAFIDSESDVLVTGFAQSSAVARRPGQLRPRDFGRTLRTLTSDQELYALTAKYDSAGDLKWLRTDANRLGIGIAADSAGNSYVSGVYYGGSYLDLWLAKFDPSGDTLWTRTFDFDVIDIGYRLALDPSGNIAATAYVGDGADFDCVTLKLTPDGDTLWTRRYDRGIDDAGAGVAIDPNGNIIVAGRTVKDVSSDALVLKYDSSGVLVWDRAFDLDLDDGAGGAACDSAGNVYVAGYTGAYGVYDCLVMKLDSTGNLLWTATYGGSGDDQAADVACDDIGDPIISGLTGDGSADLLIAKYSPFTGVADSPRSDPVPVLTRSTITAAPDFVLSVPSSGRYDIRLADLCGRTQRRVFSGHLNEGAHRFSLAGQRAGHYFVRVSAPDGGVSCLRLVLVK